MIYIILILGFVLRLISLNQSFWLDEATSATVVRDFSFIEIINKFAPGDFHPPLYYLTLKGWVSILGLSEISTRLLSVTAGLATIYFIYLIGKELFNKKLGILTAMLLATSPLHVYYSQEARMYALEALLVTAACYFFIRIIKKVSLWGWILFSFSLLLIGFTDYLPLLVLPVFWLYAIYKRKPFSWWRKFIIAHIPLTLGFSLWMPFFAKQLKAGISVKERVPGWWSVLGKTSLKETLLIPVKFMIGRISFVNKKLYLFIVSIIGAFFGYLFVKARKYFKKSEVIWLWLLIPCLLSFLIGFKLSVFSYFRLLFVLPAFYFIVASGLFALKKKFFPIALLTLVFINILMSMIYLLNPRFHREDWRNLVQFIENESKDKDSITLFVADSQMEAYRYYSKDAKISGPDGLNDDFEQIWLMRYVQPIFDPEDTLRKEVEALNYQKLGEHDFNKVVVWRYEK